MASVSRFGSRIRPSIDRFRVSCSPVYARLLWAALLTLVAACDTGAPAPLFAPCTLSPGCDDPRATCHAFAQGAQLGHLCTLDCESDVECVATGVPSECVGIREHGVIDPGRSERICVRVCPTEGCDDGSARVCAPIEDDPEHRRLCFAL